LTFKKTLSIDFDGVIHSYEKGWQGGLIYGTVTPGFWAWAEAAQQHFKLVIFSSRGGTPGGRTGMRRWLRDQWKREGHLGSMPKFEFASRKPTSWAIIDDRALTFKGDWSEFPPEMLLEFRPWNVPAIPPLQSEKADAHRPAEIL